MAGPPPEPDNFPTKSFELWILLTNLNIREVHSHPQSTTPRNVTRPWFWLHPMHFGPQRGHLQGFLQESKFPSASHSKEPKQRTKNSKSYPPHLFVRRQIKNGRKCGFHIQLFLRFALSLSLMSNVLWKKKWEESYEVKQNQMNEATQDHQNEKNDTPGLRTKWALQVQNLAQEQKKCTTLNLRLLLIINHSGIHF